MSELVVVIAVCAVSLVLTGWHARSVAGLGRAPHDLERLLAAVHRAGADFLGQETKLLALLAVIVAAVMAGPLAAFGGRWERPVQLGWAVGAFWAGSLGGVAIAFSSHWLAARTTRSALGALRRERGSAALCTLRGASAAGVFIDGLGSALAAGVFGLHHAYATRVAQLPPEAASLVASRTLAALAFGAVCAAAVFQIGGTGLHTAAGVAAAGARARHPQIARDDEQNPVLVAELVGNHVGGVVFRSTDAFAGLLLANAAVVMLCALVSTTPGAAALPALPLAVRALGQFSASVALGSLRLHGARALRVGFFGARLSHSLLLVASVYGAARWLLGAPLAAGCASAAALGVLASALSAGASLASAGQRREHGASRAGTSVARAFGLGVRRTGLLFVLVGTCLGGAWWLGAGLPIEHGGALGLALAVAALLGSGSFSVCESTFSLVSEGVHKVATLRRARYDGAALGGALELERAGAAIGHLGHTQMILGGSSAAVLAALVLALLGTGQGAGLAHPLVLVGGVLGAGALLFHIGGMLEAASRAASALDKDLSERLPAAGAAGSASGALPRYRDSVQLAAAGAAQPVLPLSLGVVLSPLALGAVLRLVYGVDGSGLVVQGLMALGALAALTGCCAALVAQGAGLELAEARRAGAEAPANSQSTLAFVERCIGPAALLGLKATAMSALATVPLLF